METSDLQKLITLVAVLLIGLGVTLMFDKPMDAAAPLLGAVPIIQPTPALVVPTAVPTPVVVFLERNQVTINQDVNVCVGWCR